MADGDVWSTRTLKNGVEGTRRRYPSACAAGSSLARHVSASRSPPQRGVCGPSGRSGALWRSSSRHARGGRRWTFPSFAHRTTGGAEGGGTEEAVAGSDRGDLMPIGGHTAERNFSSAVFDQGLSSSGSVSFSARLRPPGSGAEGRRVVGASSCGMPCHDLSSLAVGSTRVAAANGMEQGQWGAKLSRRSLAQWGRCHF